MIARTASEDTERRQPRLLDAVQDLTGRVARARSSRVVLPADRQANVARMAIGLQPWLIFKRGHAFVAWKPSKYDKTKFPLFFLETTLTGGGATFEEAMESATRTFIEAAQEKQFELGAGALLDVAALRKQGYTAQPY